MPIKQGQIGVCRDPRIGLSLGLSRCPNLRAQSAASGDAVGLVSAQDGSIECLEDGGDLVVWYEPAILAATMKRLITLCLAAPAFGGQSVGGATLTRNRKK
jgi:hypothetical protein